MKKLSLLLVGLLMAFTMNAQELTVATYNIRNNSGRGDYGHFDGWDQRKEAMCAEINFMSPDLLGCEEVLHGQVVDMLALMPEYGFIGVGRDDGKQGGEYSPIFYKKSRLKLLKQGHFWLAEDPTKPKLGWDAACVRICTWGYFQDMLTKRKFYYFNTHMDHIGVVARREGAKLIMKKMKQMLKPHETVLLSGDFNVDQRNEIYTIFTQSNLLKDSYANAKYRFAPRGTFNDFDPDSYTDSRIDHVFVSKQVKVMRYGILNDTDWRKGADGKMVRHVLSDHYPVFVKVIL
ncbi:MAG: endonuclease/exonuclease/phosphatase family protein [Prevotella sp.]|nr:endonuclease/exonuclease/phosphatase family protein [Prevotella sp.]